jgi:hypothetical protein
MQYTADYGYRDTSSRNGWGKLCSYVHKDVTNKKILVIGEDMFFPLFGDKLSNTIFWFSKAATIKKLFDDSEAYDIDYIVAFPQQLERKAAKGFIFSKPFIPELIQKFPGRFEIVKQFGLSYLVRVIH